MHRLRSVAESSLLCHVQGYTSKSTFRSKEAMPPTRSVSGAAGRLRAAARMAVVVGAAGSVGLMLHAGRGNPSRVLLTLFTLWVLAPFLAAVLSDMASKRWPAHARTALYSGTLFFTLVSLMIYGVVALGPPREK